MIDYVELLSHVKSSGTEVVADYLREKLPYVWIDEYRQLTAHATNIVSVSHGGFEFIYDWCTQLEATEAIPHSVEIEDRLVGVLGKSCGNLRMREGSRMRGWIGPTEKYGGHDRDKGHFVAHSIGGFVAGLEINLFWQRRDLNRGWSPSGKTFRSMERYCARNPGTFFFNRPLYGDDTSRPVRIEFGVLTGESLWVEEFEN